MEVINISRKTTYGTAVISLSLPVETIVHLEELAAVAGQKRSTYLRYLIRMGLTYLQLLDAQKQEDDTE